MQVVTQTMHLMTHQLQVKKVSRKSLREEARMSPLFAAARKPSQPSLVGRVSTTSTSLADANALLLSR